MARLEVRAFGSKKHLLVIPNRREVVAIKKALGLVEHSKSEGELVFDDQWQPYLRLQKKVEAK